MNHDSTPDTTDHINKVRSRMLEVVMLLLERARVHDASKLEEPEKSGYDRLTFALKDIRYGTDAYRAALAEAEPTITHHYAVNSHHPQHYPNGIEGMSLLDIIEMFCDWKAASERTQEGSLKQSLEINRERFGTSALLTTIFENTRKELGWA